MEGNFMRVLISTSTFAKYDEQPLRILEHHNINYTLNPYGRKLSSEELLDLAKEHDGVIAGTELYSSDVLEKLPHLKIISRCGVGMDTVDTDVCESLGIKYNNTPTSVTPAVAELTLGLILALSRKICLMNHDVKIGEWNKVMGNLVNKKTIGIIGLGRIGKYLAKLLSPFGVEIIAYDVFQDEEWADQNNVRYVELDELMRRSDIITLHLPYSKDNHHIINKDRLSLMKNNSCLINIARGGLVDEEYLYMILEDGSICGAALDVFETEPYLGKLRDLQNVILTPHVGSYAMEARVSMELEATNNLIMMLEGDV